MPLQEAGVSYLLRLTLATSRKATTARGCHLRRFHCSSRSRWLNLRFSGSGLQNLWPPNDEAAQPPTGGRHRFCRCAESGYVSNLRVQTVHTVHTCASARLSSIVIVPARKLICWASTEPPQPYSNHIDVTVSRLRDIACVGLAPVCDRACCQIWRVCSRSFSFLLRCRATA